MSVDNVTRRVVYEGNGSQTDFPFDFAVFKAEEVSVRRSEDGGDPEDVPTDEYNVTINSDQSGNAGGTVTFAVPPRGGTKIGIFSAVDYIQPMELTTHDGFDPRTLNRNADRIVMMIQQLLERVSRALTVGELTEESADDLRKKLLEARDLANQLLPYTDRIDLVVNDFLGTAELHFDHDYGVWGEDDTKIKMPVGGAIQAVAQNIIQVRAVGNNITAVVKASEGLDAIAAISPYVGSLLLLAPVADSVGSLGPVSAEIKICGDNVDAIKAIGDTLGLTVEAKTLPEGNTASVEKTVLEGGYRLTFGIPKGDKGDRGEKGDPGIPGGSGVYVGQGTPDGFSLYIDPTVDDWRDYYTKEEIDEMLRPLLEKNTSA